MLILDGRCYHINVDYANGKVLRNGFLGVESVSQCQLLCQTSLHCKFFSFDLDNKRCWLKKSDEGKVFKTDFVSGKKDCYEKGTTLYSINLLINAKKIIVESNNEMLGNLIVEFFKNVSKTI